MKNKILFLIGSLWVLSGQTALGEETLWLSNLPPAERQGEIRAHGMHRLSSVSAGRGKVQVVQWLRQGSSVLDSDYLLNSELAATEFYCYSPHGGLQSCRVDSTLEHVEIGFSNPKEGYYNLYAVQKRVWNDTLFVFVAKAELLNHSCRNGHKDVDGKILPHIHPDTIPLEITRSRARLENLHFFVSSGDNLDYKVTRYGAPLENAEVTFTTHHGWQKTIRSDGEGALVVELIQDYFTPWEEIDKRKIYHYMAVAEYTEEKGGTFHGETYRYIHYLASLSDGYYPSKSMYSSLTWALVLFLLFSLLIGGGVAVYRRRRIRVYRDIELFNA